MPLQINQTKRSIKLYGSIRGIEGVSPLEVYIELLSRSILATQYEGFKGVSPVRLNTETLHEVIYKAFKKELKYRLYIERLYISST
jgi:hypothetical protein